MQLYARIIWFEYLSYLAYPLEMVGAIVAPIINLSFQLILWGVIAASAPGIVNFRHIVAYFMLATALSNILLFQSFRYGAFLAGGIKYGAISQSLIKPLNVLLNDLALTIGSRGPSYALSLLLVILSLIIEPPSGLWSVLLFAMYMVLAMAISFGMNVLVGTIAFYTTESGSLKNVFQHISSVFAGLLVPLNYFPTTLRHLALILPFGVAVFGPVNALHTTHVTGETIVNLGAGVFWAIALLVVALRWWKRSLRRYEAIGI